MMAKVNTFSFYPNLFLAKSFSTFNFPLSTFNFPLPSYLASVTFPFLLDSVPSLNIIVAW